MIEKKRWIHSENEVKVVTKPWGSVTIGGDKNVGELWLNYNRNEQVGEEEKRYVLKKLYIKSGTKTSFQYHVNKLESNHLISGTAEAWQENKEGEIEKSIFEAGDSWTIPCGRKHRIVALTDMVMLEASTPEVDDVVRIDDETNRPCGRIESEHLQK